MKLKFLFSTVALAVSTHFAFAATTIKAEVNGMVCAFCAQGIEKKMKAAPATKAVFVDLKKRVVAVELKDGQNMSVTKFTEEIKDAGYDVVKVETVTQTVAQIKSALAVGEKK